MPVCLGLMPRRVQLPWFRCRSTWSSTSTFPLLAALEMLLVWNTRTRKKELHAYRSDQWKTMYGPCGVLGAGTVTFIRMPGPTFLGQYGSLVWLHCIYKPENPLSQICMQVHPPLECREARAGSTTALSSGSSARFWGRHPRPGWSSLRTRCYATETCGSRIHGG